MLMAAACTVPGDALASFEYALESSRNRESSGFTSPPLTTSHRMRRTGSG